MRRALAHLVFLIDTMRHLTCSSHPYKRQKWQKAQRFFWNNFLWWQPRTSNRYVMETSALKTKYSKPVVIEHADKYKSRCQIQGDLNINAACGAVVSGQMVQLPEAEALRPSAPQLPHKAGSRLCSCAAALGATGEGGWSSGAGMEKGCPLDWGRQGGLWAAPEQSHPRGERGCCGHFGLSTGREWKAARARLCWGEPFCSPSTYCSSHYLQLNPLTYCSSHYLQSVLQPPAGVTTYSSILNPTRTRIQTRINRRAFPSWP